MKGERIMDCWEDLEKSFNEYRERKDDRAFTEIFSKLQQYLLIKARAAQAEAKITGVYIPYEDFYSNFQLLHGTQLKIIQI